MTNQDYLTVSNPAAQESSATYFAAEESHSKDKAKELAHLKVLSEIAQSDLDTAKGAKGGKSFADYMADLVMALQAVQLMAVETGNKRADLESSISTAQAAAAKTQLKSMNDELEKLYQKKIHESLAEKIEHVCEDVAGGLMAIGGALLGQPELVVAGLLSIAAGTGLLSKATTGVADLLQDAGMSKQSSEILAGALVTMIVMALTAGTCGLQGGAEDAESLLSRAGSTLWNNKLLLMTTIQSLAQTGMVSNIVAACYSGDDSESAKKTSSTVMSVIAGLATLACSFGGFGESVADGVKSSLTVTMLRMTNAGQTFASYGQFGAQIGQQTYAVEAADVQKNYAGTKGDYILLESMMKMLSNTTTSDQKHLANIMQQNNGNQVAQALTQGWQGFANAIVSTANTV